jgi:hypothetical protein
MFLRLNTGCFFWKAIEPDLILLLFARVSFDFETPNWLSSVNSVTPVRELFYLLA